MSSKLDEYFVLRAGATQEEQWSWDEIAERCRRGEFDAGTQVFLPDENRWVPVAETDLAPELEAAAGGGDAEEQPEDRAAREARELLEEEYEDLRYRLEDGPGAVDPWIDAGCLAVELGRTDDARGHFQRALDLHPFHPRVAQEVRRSFPRSQWRRFERLERPDAAWENLGDILAFPLALGPVYAAIPVALFFGLLFVPRGGLIVLPLAVLWCYRCMRAVASGHTEPVPYSQGLVDPVRNIVLPGVAAAVACAEWMLLFWGLARLGMLLEGKGDVGVVAYTAASPVLTVALSLCALAYLPAVLVLFDPDMRGVWRAVNPVRVVRGVIAMQSEYAMGLVLLFATALASAVISALTVPIPFAGKLVLAVAATFLMFVGGFVLGRLRARVDHLIGR